MKIKNLHHYSHNINWNIYFSFGIAILLHIIPYTRQVYIFQPLWIVLLLIYWIMVLPYRINIGTGLILGCMMDFILKTTLGIHMLAFSIISYIIILKYQLLRNILFIQQMLSVMILSFIVRIIIHLNEMIIFDIAFDVKIFWNSIVDGIIWLGIYLLMNRIVRPFYIK